MRLPFVQDRQTLSDSRQIAEKLFLNLKIRFTKNPGLANEYKSFMTECLRMGNIKLVTSSPNTSYYLPHHVVLMADSLTTKLRLGVSAVSSLDPQYRPRGRCG